LAKEEKLRHYRIDAEKMLDRVLELADQVEGAWERSRDFGADLGKARGPIVICGMGGSAIGGKMLADLVKKESPFPVYLERGYSLPSFVDRSTPVICVSYSGNTEEVISSFKEALERRCPLTVITSGGMLAEEAEKAGVPAHMTPAGMPPRAALGHLFAPLLRLAGHLGIYELSDDEIALAIRKLRALAARYSLDAGLAENMAMQLTKKLYGKIPLIYSGDGLLAGAAYRWKCQFNENSKCMAFYNTFSELGHNEIMGWDSPERLREDFYVIMLMDCEDHPRVQKRMDITFRELEPLGGGGLRIKSDGEEGRRGRLARLFSILALGDFTSVYLAVEYGKDPTPIEKIEQIKEALRSEDE
jgi:glucose/mannose-6-phosphate isomerase